MGFAYGFNNRIVELNELDLGNSNDGISPESGYSKSSAEKLAAETKEKLKKIPAYVKVDVRVERLFNGNYAVRNCSAYRKF